MIQEEAFRCKEITQKLLEFSRGGETPPRADRPGRADPGGARHGAAPAELPRARRSSSSRAAESSAWVNAQEIKSGGAQPRRQRPGQHGRRRHADDHAAAARRHGRAGLHRHRLRHDGRGAGEHLRAVLHAQPHRQGHRPGPVDQPPHRQPARRRDRGGQRGPGPGQHVHGPAAAASRPTAASEETAAPETGRSAEQRRPKQCRQASRDALSTS